ncbi:Uncharacterised protein r2_g2527 [Pycnogonum litorale]
MSTQHRHRLHLDRFVVGLEVAGSNLVDVENADCPANIPHRADVGWSAAFAEEMPISTRKGNINSLCRCVNADVGPMSFQIGYTSDLKRLDVGQPISARCVNADVDPISDSDRLEVG